jgi:predicted DCC family thiol-disulfide oxidoreductase YuxK
MTQPALILFDGVCNFCNGAVNFVIKHDKKKQFRFAPLQSEAGQRALAQHQLSQEEFRSFVLIENGHVYQKSTATLRVLKYFPWYWQELQIFRIIPAFLRDAIYDFIARNRYKWFGRKESCMIPTDEVRNRFL